MEKEYRFFVHHEYSKISACAYYKMREQDNQMIAYLDFPIQGWNSPEGLPIYRVCVGVDAPLAAEAQLAELMWARKIWPLLGVSRAAIS